MNCHTRLSRLCPDPNRVNQPACVHVEDNLKMDFEQKYLGRWVNCHTRLSSPPQLNLTTLSSQQGTNQPAVVHVEDDLKKVFEQKCMGRVSELSHQAFKSTSHNSALTIGSTNQAAYMSDT